MTKIPINIKSGIIEEKKVETIIGIDLGTTNSLVAMVNNDTRKPFCLGAEDKDTIVPSIIYIDKNKTNITGKEAKKFLNISPERTIYSVKRLMGKSYEDFEKIGQKLSYPIFDNGKNDLVRVQIDEGFYTPIELSSFILAELKHRAEIYTKQKISKAVITVPAYFNDVQRQATRDAGKLAGLEVLRILNEPTAAALAYGFGLEKNTQKTIAVYDLGGGTFDISILQLQNGIYEVLSTHGNTMLGGDDFDNALTKFWIEKYPVLVNYHSLRTIAEEARIHLSLHDNFERKVDLNNENISLILDKYKLEELIKPLINITLQSCRNAVKDADISLDEIEEVILVGGTTRTPLVKKAVSSFFQHSHINDGLNPDEIVALGAAVEADILAGNNKDMLLLDVTPLSLGIETLGGLMDVMITRNTKIPCSIAKEYTTSIDGQVNLSINVFQGERELIADNRKLGEFILKSIPSMPAGFPKIKVTFNINADGILAVKAEETRSGTHQEIELKPQFGLTDEEMENMLLASIQNAEKDMSARLLLEAVNEGKQLIYVTQRFIEKNKNLISEAETAQTKKMLDELNQTLNSIDKNEIVMHIEKLNEYTRPFAERLMDVAVSQALKGTKLS